MSGPIDIAQAQWRRERPDLDPSPIGIFGRASRLTRIVERAGRNLLRRFKLRSWEYEVIATLRRSGPDCELTAGELGQALFVTSGALTNRIDQLERSGLVERRDHPDDRRAVIVRLTPDGRAQADRVVAAYLSQERELLEPLTTRERKHLEGLLRKLLVALDPSGSSRQTIGE